MEHPHPHSRRGFTLIELLVVVSILSVLASLTLVAVFQGKQKALQGLAKGFVACLDTQAARYAMDMGKYPGQDCGEKENAFPALFEALYGSRSPQGGGGQSAPYLPLDRQATVVPDADGAFRQATQEEIEDRSVSKYIQDPWSHPYIYRENRSRASRPWMRRPETADIYSTGRDGIDQTLQCKTGDDLGNW